MTVRLDFNQHGELVEVDVPARAPSCSDNAPPWFDGHWREWHRGHGCDKDDGRPSAAAQRPIVVVSRGDEDLMMLPEGETCETCANYKRCSWLVGARATSTICDWSPSRFRPRPRGDSETTP